jgi:hypothetical protein
MEVKNLCESQPKEELIARLEKLSPDSKSLWGKMNVGQMLAHLQMPMGVALGDHKLKGNFFAKILGGMIKSKLWEEKPFKKGLPTAPSFKMTGEKEFNAEKASAIEYIRRFKEENISNLIHPFFGKMTIEQWGKANWKHIDHHLQQFGV